MRTSTRQGRADMALLLPEADGVADVVARQLPGATAVRYGEADPGRLGEVTFYCLPYMGDAASVALIGDLPKVSVIQSLSSGVDDVLAAVPSRATLCNGHGLGHEEGTAELADLAAAADVMVICIALHPATRGLVSAQVLAALPDAALVVNVARGPIVAADALTSELNSGRL